MSTKSRPTQKQLNFLSWEFGGFFHFGIRTFYEGHKDWDMKEMPLEGFTPTDLDCENWIKTIKEAGASYAILVCKHHDGFANWPSKYTEYSVKNTPWKNGQGDVVRDFTDACRKYGVHVGLYYSPAEFGSVNKDTKDYDDYFINQASELLTNYGKIEYLWFDGCGSENHKYDTDRIVAEIRRLQPDILLFNMWDPDTRWVGNESGLAHMPNANVVNALDFSVQTQVKDTLEDACFLPVECDFRMRRHNWFYSDSDEDTVKSVDELLGLYYYSVGRGANFLINIGPDRRGLLPEKDASALLAMGKELRKRFKNPIPAKIEMMEAGVRLRLETPALINHAVLMENLTAAEYIHDYVIKIHPYSYGSPITVFQSNTIGHKAICPFPAVYTECVEIHAGELAGNIISSKLYYVE